MEIWNATKLFTLQGKLQNYIAVTRKEKREYIAIKELRYVSGVNPLVPGMCKSTVVLSCEFSFHIDDYKTVSRPSLISTDYPFLEFAVISPLALILILLLFLINVMNKL